MDNIKEKTPVSMSTMKRRLQIAGLLDSTEQSKLALLKKKTYLILAQKILNIKVGKITQLVKRQPSPPVGKEREGGNT